MIYSIEQIKERIVPVAEKYRLPAVYIFGSYARGEATEQSDIDILVDKTGSELDDLFAMGGLYNDLCESVGKPVDLITMDAIEQESTRRRMPWMMDNLNKDRVRIYGQ